MDPLPTVKTSPKENNFLVTLLSILLLLSCIIAGFFAYQTQNLVKQLSESRIQNLATQTPTPTPDPTANWKTYTDTKLGFSFKYHPEWVVAIDDSGLIYLNNKKVNSTITKTDQVFFTIKIEEDANEANWLKNKLNETRNSNIENINNVKYEITDLRSHSIGGYSYMTAKTANRNSIITFGLSNADVEIYFDQILSTFKFTDSGQVACAEEARICPDGSSVGRIGPNCEFAKCPATSPQP